MRFPRGTCPPTAFDFSDVRDFEIEARAIEARAMAHELWLQRQLRAALEQRSIMFRRGYNTALEQVGADVTITDGIPMEVS